MVFLFQTKFAESVNEKKTQAVVLTNEQMANNNYAAVGYALANYCKSLSVNNYEMLFPKNATDGNSFRLIMYSDDKRVKTLDFAINEAKLGDEKYTVKVVPPVDVNATTEKSAYSAPVTRTVEKDMVTYPYNTLYATNQFTLKEKPLANTDESGPSTIHFVGNTQTSAFVLAQTNVESSMVYTKAVEDSNTKLGYLYSSLQSENTSYVVEPAFNTLKNFFLNSLITAASGPKNSNYFILAQKDLRYDFLVPGKNADNIIEKVTSYYLVPKDYVVGDSLPIDYQKNQVKVVQDTKDNTLVNFVYKGKTIATQDRETAGVPDVNQMVGGSEMKLVSTVPVYMYYQGNDRLAKTVVDFDGSTEVEVDGKMQTPKKGSYNVFTVTVTDDETGATKQQIAALQQISDKTGAKLPKGITKEKELFVLESIPNALTEKNIMPILITLPASTVNTTGETPFNPGNIEAFQTYMKTIGTVYTVEPTKDYFTFSKDGSISGLKPDALSKIILGETKKSEYVLSPK